MPTWQPRTTSPQATRGMPALYPGLLRGHTTLSNPLPGRWSPLFGYVVRAYEALAVKCGPSHFRQPVTAHIQPPAERKDGDDGKSSPMISNSRL